MGKRTSARTFGILTNLSIMLTVIALFAASCFLSYKLVEAEGPSFFAYVPILLFFVILEGVAITMTLIQSKLRNAAMADNELIEGLTDDCDTIVLVDLDKDFFRMIKAPLPVRDLYVELEKKGARAYREFFIENVLCEDSRDYISPMLRYDHVVDELSNNPHFYIIYNMKRPDGTKHHYEAKVMRVGNFEEEHRFVFAARCIDRQELDEAQLRMHLEDSVTMRTQELQEKNERLNRLNEDIIGFLGNIVEARNLESGEHVRRVKGFTHILAQRVMEDYPEFGLTPDRVDLITSASALHDLGKITIPDAILLKPGKLTVDEFETMKTHSAKGCEILKMAGMDWSEEYLQTSLDICKYHHEKYDGKGYPEGLKGEEIPLSAQIVSIVDCLDALINKRCYKDAYPFEVGFQMILDGECGVFSPKIISCFKKCKEQFKEHLEDRASDYSTPSHIKTMDSSLEGISILLVEDDELSRDITATVLSSSGALVTEVGSGAEAIEMLQSAPKDAFDAILMDIYMPELDGFQTTQAIRHSKIYGAETIPILAISVSKDDMDVERATELGMNAYLFKPISVGQVSKALMYCMKDQANALQKKLTKTSRVANRDSLTGVRSMSAYMDKVEQLKEKVKNADTASFALVECDLNGLKGVNDTYGHDIGDVYIVNSCHAICDVFKHSPVYRIGGDEFVVVLEGEDLDNRDNLMKQLKAASDYSMSKQDPVHGRISIASGIAVYDAKQDKTVGDVLKRADSSMYNDKRMMHMTVRD